MPLTPPVPVKKTPITPGPGAAQPTATPSLGSSVKLPQSSVAMPSMSAPASPVGISTPPSLGGGKPLVSTPQMAPQAATIRPNSATPDGPVGGAQPPAQQPTPSPAQPPAQPAQPAQPQQGQAPQQPAQPQQGQGQTQPPTSLEQANDQFATQVDQILGTIDQIKADLQKDDGSLLLLAAWWSDVSNSMDQYYSQMMGEFKKQNAEEDPAVKASIDIIKEEAARQRQEALQELNARGISQSGVVAETIARLQRGELSSIQQTVAGRLSEMKTQMMGALTSFTGYRMQMLQTYFTKKADAVQAEKDRKAGLMNALLAAETQLTQTFQQKASAELGAQVQREGYQSQEKISAGNNVSQEKIAAGNNQTQITTTGMNNTSAESIAKGNQDTQYKIASEGNVSAEKIAAGNQSTQLAITDKQIAAERDKWTAQINSNEKLASMDNSIKLQLADMNAQTSLKIADMQGKNSLLSDQMKSAQDLVNNLLLPLALSGKVNAQEIMGGLPQDMAPEVRSIYEQALGLINGPAKPAEASPVGSSGPASPVLRAAQEEEGQAYIAELDKQIAELDKQIAEAEKAYLGAPKTPGVLPGGAAFAPTPRSQTSAEVELLYKRRQALIDRRNSLKPSTPQSTPTSPKVRTPQ